jgi:hypothetical protein
MWLRLTLLPRNVALCSLLWLITGCHSAGKHQLSAITSFDQGVPADAVAAFDLAAEARGAEAELIAADQAIALLMAGDPARCETSLKNTREQIDFLSQKDLTEQTRSVLTDDQAISWSGREFELRMIDNLLVLANLMGNHQDAFAYSSQAMERVYSDQTQLPGADRAQPAMVTVGHSEEAVPVPPPPPRFAPNALAAYLQAAIRSENPMDGDLTTTAIQQVSFWNGKQALAKNNNSAAHSGKLGTLSPRGHGVLHVVTLVGRVTDWKSERAMPTTSALLIADQILSAVGDHTLPPTVAPVLIARPVDEASRHPFVTVAQVQGQSAVAPVRSTTLVDLNTAAFDSYQADRDEQLARAVARRVIKKGAVYAAKNQMSVAGGSGTDLLLNLGGIVWEALEKADTRHLQLLPERIEVLQMQLPEGQHVIQLSTALSGTAGAADNRNAIAVPIFIDDGRNTLVVCFRPKDRFAGSILRSDSNPPMLLSGK